MRKNVFITGATSGIGQAAVRWFSQRGYQVYATYRAAADEEVLSAIPNVYPVRLDLTSSSDMAHAVQQVTAQLQGQGLYALINNAGLTYTAPFEFADEQRARQVLEVNLLAPFRLTQALLPLLKQYNQRHPVKARVLNVASWAGRMGQPFIAFYNASKFALIGLTESMYYDLGLLDIHTVLVSPGITKTPLLEKTTADGVASLHHMPKAGKQFYQPYIDHYQTMSDSSHESSFFRTPEQVAQQLFAIVETTKPRYSYNLAMDATIIDKVVTRLLPFSWRAALNRSIFKLNKRKSQPER